MKNILLSAVFLCFAFAANAQDISIKFNSEQINEDTVNVSINEDGEFTFAPIVHNNLSDTLKAQALCSAIEPNGISVYSICAGTCRPGNLSPIFNVAPNADFATIFDVTFDNPNNTDGLFVLQVYNTSGHSDTATVYIRVKGQNGINAANSLSVLNAYPNPTRNQVNIEYALPEGCTSGNIVVCNVLGSVVRQVKVAQTSGTVQMNVADLPYGIYMYGVVANNRMYAMKKVAIQ